MSLKREVPDKPVMFNVFSGSDYLTRGEVRERMISDLRSSFGDISEETYDSSKEEISEFIEKIYTPDLFNEVRLFLLRHGEELRKNEIEELAASVQSEIPGVYIIMDINVKGRDTRKYSVTELKKVFGITKSKAGKKNHIRMFRYDLPPSYKLAEWLCEKAGDLFGRKMLKKDAECLIDKTGDDVNMLYAELQKIDIHLKEGLPVTKEVIEEIAVSSREKKSFELAKALGGREFSYALELVDSMYSTNVYLPLTVYALSAHFWKLFRVYSFAGNNPSLLALYKRSAYMEKNQAAFQIGVGAGVMDKNDSPKKAYPVMVLSKIIEQAGGFDINGYKRIFSLLKAFDVGVKTGRITPERKNLEILCYSIIQSGKNGKKAAA